MLYTQTCGSGVVLKQRLQMDRRLNQLVKHDHSHLSYYCQPSYTCFCANSVIDVSKTHTYTNTQKKFELNLYLRFKSIELNFICIGFLIINIVAKYEDQHNFYIYYNYNLLNQKLFEDGDPRLN